MQHTTNYNLNQWEDGDVVRREDFNADNAKIDTALKAVSDAVPEIVFGTYVGDGKSSQTISLGRMPKLVLVENKKGSRSGNFGPYGGLAAQGYPATVASRDFIKLTDDGFVVQYYSSTSNGVYANENNQIYYYVAIF